MTDRIQLSRKKGWRAMSDQAIFVRSLIQHDNQNNIDLIDASLLFAMERLWDLEVRTWRKIKSIADNQKRDFNGQA